MIKSLLHNNFEMGKLSKKYSNPTFFTIEKQLLDLSKELDIRFIGGYNADKFNLTDDGFIDFIHADKKSIYKVWNHRL